MKVLLTGATGYIGHQLAIELAKREFIVNALVRDMNSDRIPKHINIIPFKGDICDLGSIQKAIKDCEYVFHAAAFTDMKCNKINKFYCTNVQGTTNVLNASLDAKIKKVIYTSTLSVFGPALCHVPITEKQPRLNSYSNDYELTKKMAEEEIFKFVDKGLPCTILSVSRVYGPGLDTFSNGVSTIIKKVMNDKFLFVPSKLNIEANYVFIDDVINAQLLALENGKSGEKYIIGGENIDYDGLFKRIKTISKSNISIVKINYSLLKSLFSFFTTFSRLLNLKVLVTPKVLDSLFTHRSASSKKAISSLNYKITPLNFGLSKTINFLNS